MRLESNMGRKVKVFERGSLYKKLGITLDYFRQVLATNIIEGRSNWRPPFQKDESYISWKLRYKAARRKR
jgi:hypothetical protein